MDWKELTDEEEQRLYNAYRLEIFWLEISRMRSRLNKGNLYSDKACSEAASHLEAAMQELREAKKILREDREFLYGN